MPLFARQRLLPDFTLDFIPAEKGKYVLTTLNV